jgi:hypothetical protein
MRKRIALLITALMLALTMIAGPVASGALAAPPPCEPGAPGCKTGDDPDKNNPKFLETQRGNTNAQGTEDTERDCKVFGGSHGDEVRCR